MTIPDGADSTAFNIATIIDSLPEGSEIFTVSISGATGGDFERIEIDPTAGSVDTAIVDEKESAKVSISDGTPDPATEGTDTSITFTVTLSEPVDHATTVTYKAVNGTAKAGIDYDLTEGTLTFAANETSKTVTVTVRNDEVLENPESFTVQLGPTTGGLLIADGSGTGSIVDDDQAATVSISDGTPNPATEETDATITFTVTLSEPIDHVTKVSYRTTDGTAKAGQDYEQQSGTLTFNAFETSKTVTVTVLNDEIFENAAESFGVVLRGTTPELHIIDGSGTGRIVDDDQAATVSISDGTPNPATEATGATITFTVTLSEPIDHVTKVSYGTADGTATAGSDYVKQSGVLTFNAFETSKTVTITVLNDNIFENATESFGVVLRGTTPELHIVDGSGKGHVIDDDAAALVSIGDGHPMPATEDERDDHLHGAPLPAGRSCDLRCLHNGGRRCGGGLRLRVHLRHPHLRRGRNQQDRNRHGAQRRDPRIPRGLQRGAGRHHGRTDGR